VERLFGTLGQAERRAAGPQELLKETTRWPFPPPFGIIRFMCYSQGRTWYKDGGILSFLAPAR
jgi:hypothetical protein